MQFQFIQSSASTPRPFRRGTSLIEILVVLVILVIGILSIVRLFPAGFIALRNAENNTFAARLAQGALEQLKKSGNGLPDAIYMYSDADGFNPNFAPDDFGPYPATGTANVAYNDINKQRYISNETITVPAPRSAGMAYLPLYVLNYGPVYLPAFPAPPAYSAHYLTVNSLPWTPRVGDSRLNPNEDGSGRSIDNPQDILQSNQQQYMVDNAAGQIAVPPALYPQTFTVVVQGTTPATPVKLTITVPASNDASTPYTGGWFDPTSTPYLQADPFTGVMPSGTELPTTTWVSVTLYRPFSYVATSTSPNFDSDPYEYALYSSNIGTDVNPGVIAFNTLASGQNGRPPLKARISYMVQDWHILHEDHDVSTGSSTVRLTLGHLKKIGDVQFDQTTFSGLVPSMTKPSDIVIVDLDTGDVTPLNTGNVQDVDDNSGAAIGNGTYQVSYQGGRITFPDNNTAKHVRIFYTGDADWALAVQKAPSAYRIVNAGVNNIINAPANADYQVLTTAGPTPNNCVIDLANERAYFPLCDAGKTVEFDGISYTDSNNNPHTIGEGTAAISTDPMTVGAGQRVVYVNLGSGGLNASNILPDTPSTGGTSAPIVQAVRGISARATVIWRERNRWRTRTIDTLLTQTQ